MKRPRMSVFVSSVIALSGSAMFGCGSEKQGLPGAGNGGATVPHEAKGPAVSSGDPCSLLSIEELRTALPELNGPAQPDPVNNLCIYSIAFVKTGPVSREDLELEHDLFGLAPRTIEVTGAEWAVLRIDTSEGKAVDIADALVGELADVGVDQTDEDEVTTVFDVIATGPSGSVAIAPTGDGHPPLNSAGHEALIRLLGLAYSRL